MKGQFFTSLRAGRDSLGKWVLETYPENRRLGSQMLFAGSGSVLPSANGKCKQVTQLDTQILAVSPVDPSCHTQPACHLPGTEEEVVRAQQGGLRSGNESVSAKPSCQ